MSTLSRVKGWLELVPLVIAAMRAIEAQIPETGQGSAKLLALRAALEAGWDSVQALLGGISEVWPRIEALVASLAAAFNKTGLFKKEGAK